MEKFFEDLYSIKTIQAWESGKHSPNHAALRLLEIIDQGIYVPHVITNNPSQNKNRRVAVHLS